MTVNLNLACCIKDSWKFADFWQYSIHIILLFSCHLFMIIQVDMIVNLNLACCIKDSWKYVFVEFIPIFMY